MPNPKSTKTARTGARKTSRNPATVTNKRSRNAFTHNRRNQGMVLVAVLAVAAISLIGIAVAAFSDNLQINGSATVKGTTWDVHFENLQQANKSANVEEIQAPTIKQDTNGNDTIIGDYQVKLKYPSDHIEYIFDVANRGDLDAEITAISINTGSDLTCDYGDTAPTHNVCDKLIYTLKYSNGQPVNVGDTLVVGQVKTLALHLEFDSTASNDYLPKQDVDVSGLEVTITFSQQ